MADVLAVRNELRLQNWMEIIRECQESGSTNKELCAQRGISDLRPQTIEAETAQEAKAPEPTVEEVTIAAHKRKKKRTYEELAEDLPVEEILLRERNRIRAYRGDDRAAVPHEAQSGVPVLGGGGHDEEVCGRRTAGPAIGWG